MGGSLCAGSGRPGIGRDRAAGKGSSKFPIAHRRGGERHRTERGAGWQIWDRCAGAQAAGEAAGAVMLGRLRGLRPAACWIASVCDAHGSGIAIACAGRLRKPGPLAWPLLPPATSAVILAVLYSGELWAWSDDSSCPCLSALPPLPSSRNNRMRPKLAR